MNDFEIVLMQRRFTNNIFRNKKGDYYVRTRNTSV
jgi:hypothetical protein